MNYYHVIPLRQISPTESILTYHADATYDYGAIVHVPIGSARTTAVVIGQTDKPSFETKPITAPLESRALPKPLVQLAMWMSEYYQTHPSKVFQMILPAGLLKSRREVIPQDRPRLERKRTNIVLNTDQSAALVAIGSHTKTQILHGVTGSGKTTVYIEAAKKCISNTTSAVVLVPEIALTSQLIAEFNNHFEHVIVTHSTMTEAERHRTWRKVLLSTEPLIIIGPRSALFMPVEKLGLIVIDECHEPTYKQDSAPRYNALRVARKLADYSGSRLVLGSATPLVTDYYHAERASAILSLPRRAVSTATAPVIHTADLTKRNLFTRHRYLSNKLLTALQNALDRGEQVLLYHNRRGTAPTTLCEHCGWRAHCPTCIAPLALHADTFNLRCHMCGYTARVPTSCPDCGKTDVVHKGIGTKQIETDIKKLFPKFTTARFDGDNLAADNLSSNYQRVYDGDINIIVGSQVIAKGLDLPKLSLVGVIQADSGLVLPDYTASERSFQLLSQVVGRVGRFEHPSTIIIQSFQLNHPSIQYGMAQDYHSFYEHTISERRAATFPPFIHLAKVIVAYKTESLAVKHARDIALRLSKINNIHVQRPVPAFAERAGGYHRWQIVLKSSDRGQLLLACKQLTVSKHVQFDIDPHNLLS